MAAVKKLSSKRFAEFSQAYVTSSGHAKGKELDRFVELVKPQKKWRMLDVATGGGHTALKFSPLVQKVAAVDLTPRMLKTARSFLQNQGATNAIFTCAEAEKLPFADQTFDLVTCRIAAHHFPNCQKFFQENARVLKNDGVFVFQDQILPQNPATAAFVDGFEKLRDPSHNRAYSEPEWRAMAETGGLEVMHAERIIKRHDLVDWAKRQGCSAATISELYRRLKNASREIEEWMAPEGLDTLATATFVNRHLIMSGVRKN